MIETNKINIEQVFCDKKTIKPFYIGLYSAITTRSILILPLSAIVSGASFGFFLGVGSMIRSEEKGISEGVWRVERGRLVRGEEIWRERIKME